MGLDAVEIVLRCEEVFDLHIEDSETGQITTVGQLFEFLCTRLALPNGTAAPTEPGQNRLRPRLSITPQLTPWTREDLWSTLIALLCEQQGLRPDQIRYHARLAEDLGIG